ncbi:PRC-barrel domain-containing protein [Actinoplanes sp. NPDC051851]|uniref:PRC-barrel domain-containing protein n=1 Tax=Actinoplanes sp. NPDC051851 TaxID=3154753 RepID=UPI00343402AC
MITQEHVHSLQGSDVRDTNGDRIGTAGQVWTDAAGQPTWLSVSTGLLGHSESLIPLQDAHLHGEELTVPFDKEIVKNAPDVSAAHDEPLTQSEVDELTTYYRVNQHESHRAGTDTGMDTGVGVGMGTGMGMGTAERDGTVEGAGTLEGIGLDDPVDEENRRRLG